MIKAIIYAAIFVLLSSLCMATSWEFDTHSGLVDEWLWSGINYEDVNSIKIINDPNKVKAGWYSFGGKIWLNVAHIGSEQEFELILEHELGHHYWMTYMTNTDKINYCKEIEQEYDKCFETFAWRWLEN